MKSYYQKYFEKAKFFTPLSEIYAFDILRPSNRWNRFPDGSDWGVKVQGLS